MTGEKTAGSRRGLRRALGLVAILAATYGLAVLVARPHVPDPATNPYAGKRGGSLSKSVGIEMRRWRGDVSELVEPQTILRGGDLIMFKVRGEAPSYVEVRLRDGANAPVTIFPADRSTTTPRVLPGRALAEHRVAPGGGKLVVTALFSDHPSPVGAPPAPDTLVTTAVVTKE